MLAIGGNYIQIKQDLLDLSSTSQGKHVEVENSLKTGSFVENRSISLILVYTCLSSVVRSVQVSLGQTLFQTADLVS